MTIIKYILKVLSGKKSAIASIVGFIVAYLAVKDIFGQPEVILVMSITTVLFGGASYYTGKLIYPKTK